MRRKSKNVAAGFSLRGRRARPRRLKPAATSFLFFALCGIAFAQQDRTDRVEFRGKDGKATVRTGLILEESPAKVVLRQAGGERLEIPSEEIIDVDYDGAPPAVASAKNAERSRLLEAAAQRYEQALKELKPNQKALESHLRFRLADLLFARAQEAGVEERKQALTALRQFLKERPAARQALPAWDRLGQLAIREGGDAAEALAGVRAVQLSFAKDPGFGLRCDLLALKLTLLEAEALRATKPEAAKERSVIALAAADKLRGEVQGATLAEAKRYRSYALAGAGRGAEALAEIDGLLAGAEDEAGQARLLFERGEIKRTMGQPDQARWDFLRLELLYANEKEMQLRALQKLADVFEQLGEPGRARDYRERAKR